MSASRPFALTIAGFDPSGGAGVLADIKTLEQHRVYGLAVATANTLQTENVFHGIEWTEMGFVLNSIGTLFGSYKIKAVKIGIVPSLEYLRNIVIAIKRAAPTTKIIWDPVLKSTTDFEFTTIANRSDLIEILQQLDLITPNFEEILKLSAEDKTAEEIAKSYSNLCPVLLKGGHHPKLKGMDILFAHGASTKILPKTEKVYPKHGSGCVLSSAIAANFALGQDLVTSCREAKTYIENYLNTNTTLLGYHYV